MNDFKRLLLIGRSSFYGYSYPRLPDEIQGSNIERSEIFLREKVKKLL
jgi:hypothetical protein